MRRAVVSISDKASLNQQLPATLHGVVFHICDLEVVAPSSETIYAEITGRYGARKLADLQAVLGALEASLAAGNAGGSDDAESSE
jgi:hypothetical protein